MKKVVILQSSYIPWKGYFDLIHDADHFVFYDDVQFTKNDWRNRNKIKTSQGSKWLTVPVGERINRTVREVEIISTRWQSKHLKSIRQNYCRSAHFADYEGLLEEIYLDTEWKSLSELNQHLTRRICSELGIATQFTDSKYYSASGNRTDRLIALIKAVGGNSYISGPAARSYIDEERFKDEKIKIMWKDYNGYPAYRQLYGNFEHRLSIFDLLFNMGPDAPYYIWGWRE